MYSQTGQPFIVLETWKNVSLESILYPAALPDKIQPKLSLNFFKGCKKLSRGAHALLRPYTCRPCANF